MQRQICKKLRKRYCCCVFFFPLIVVVLNLQNHTPHPKFSLCIYFSLFPYTHTRTHATSSLLSRDCYNQPPLPYTGFYICYICIKESSDWKTKKHFTGERKKTHHVNKTTAHLPITGKKKKINTHTYICYSIHMPCPLLYT
jgi:hypothetical protein